MYLLNFLWSWENVIIISNINIEFVNNNENRVKVKLINNIFGLFKVSFKLFFVILLVRKFGSIEKKYNICIISMINENLKFFNFENFLLKKLFFVRLIYIIIKYK